MTVFIGAGYEKEVKAMLNDDKVQPGMESRFDTKINFEDYTREELVAIWKMKCQNREYPLKVSTEVTKAAIDRVQKEQRAQVHPSNGRKVEMVLKSAIENQELRITRMLEENDDIEDEVFNRAEQVLTLEDVLAPPAETLEDVWKAIDEFPGLDDLKNTLKEIQDYEEAEREKGRTPKETYNFVVKGPPGYVFPLATRKSQLSHPLSFPLLPSALAKAQSPKRS